MIGDSHGKKKEAKSKPIDGGGAGEWALVGVQVSTRVGAEEDGERVD